MRRPGFQVSRDPLTQLGRDVHAVQAVDDRHREKLIGVRPLRFECHRERESFATVEDSALLPCRVREQDRCYAERVLSRPVGEPRVSPHVAEAFRCRFGLGFGAEAMDREACRLPGSTIPETFPSDIDSVPRIASTATTASPSHR